MPRQTWVYPNDGGEPYIKGERDSQALPKYATIMPDLPDFVSPIDGLAYSGRAGMREHNRRHNVVPNADLKGLPTLHMNSDTRSSDQKRSDAAHRKGLIIQNVNRHYR